MIIIEAKGRAKEILDVLLEDSFTEKTIVIIKNKQ